MPTPSKNQGRIIGSVPHARMSVADREFLQAVPHSGSLVHLGDQTGPVDKRTVFYRCGSGHTIEITFAANAAVPQLWQCASHSSPAPLLHQDDVAAAGAVLADLEEPGRDRTSGRTHYDHVRARRTPADLEALLQERLEALRARRGEAHGVPA